MKGNVVIMMLKLTGMPCMFPELLVVMVLMSAWASTQRTPTGPASTAAEIVPMLIE